MARVEELAMSLLRGYTAEAKVTVEALENLVNHLEAEDISAAVFRALKAKGRDGLRTYMRIRKDPEALATVFLALAFEGEDAAFAVAKRKCKGAAA